MERITISLDEDLAGRFDAFIREHGYTNRSEALRDLIRDNLGRETLGEPREGYCVATLSYVYNHHQLDLAGRLAGKHHEHHDLTLATQHVHLDHDNCLEAVFLRGPVNAVRAFADTVIAERGVRHGSLHMVPVKPDTGHRHVRSKHVHYSPLT